MTKQCTRCKEEKGPDEFWTHKKGGKLKLQSMCKPCSSARRREYYLANKEQEVKRNNAWREEQMKWYRELKAGPCTDCGKSFHHSAMHWDHLPGYIKLDDVGRLVSGFFSRSKIEEEIKKCELVCAVCHAIRTWVRRHGDIA